MNLCLGHLDPIESITKMGLPTYWFSRVIGREYLKHLSDEVKCYPTESIQQHPISHFESLAGAQEMHRNASVGSECAVPCRCHTRCWKGGLAQSCEQCTSNSAAQCRTRGTGLATGFIAVGC